MPEADPPRADQDGGGGVGDLAIVLHSHMPYVEGFGTYPFGEEWLFDGVIRSYLPVLEHAQNLTMTLTPVLADQLEDAGTQRRLREFLVRYRIGSAEADAGEVPPECRRAAKAEAARYHRVLELLDRVGGNPLRAFQSAAEEGRIAVATSAATHAILPLLATREGLDLQVDAGVRSHRRRFDWGGGFWLPECAYAPGIEARLEEHGVRWFCTSQNRHEEGTEAMVPVATTSGPVAFTIDWDAVQWMWASDGYPADPEYTQFAGKSWRGTRIWRVGGGPYDPEAGLVAARRQAAEFIRSAADRLRAFAAERGRRGLIVFAIDTELLGHWWSEGPEWLAEVVHLAGDSELRMVTLDQAVTDHPTRETELKASTWGEEQDFRTWDSPLVADLAWGARRSELRLLRAVRRGIDPERAARATRELLAIQSSDWAFLDGRGGAGDYAYLRAISHAEAMLEALDSEVKPEPQMRSLAPQLSISPLLAP